MILKGFVLFCIFERQRKGEGKKQTKILHVVVYAGDTCNSHTARPDQSWDSGTQFRSPIGQQEASAMTTATVSQDLRHRKLESGASGGSDPGATYAISVSYQVS